jgi:hypothetical protein
MTNIHTFDTIHVMQEVWYTIDNNESSVHIKDIITPRIDTDSKVSPVCIHYPTFALQIMSDFGSIQ